MQKDTRASAHLTTYVEPYREPPPTVLEVETWRELPSAPITLPMPGSSYVDRAKGFGIATLPLAAVAGIVAALAGVLGWQVPVASLVTLLLALGGFAGVWLIAYIAHLAISPDGSLFLHTLMAWNYLGREQRERHKRYRVKGGGR